MARSRLEALAHAAGRTVASKWRLLLERRVEELRAKAQEESLRSEVLIEGARTRAKARAEARARGASAAVQPGPAVVPPTMPQPPGQTSAELQSTQTRRVLEELRVMRLPASQLQVGEPLSLLPESCPAEDLPELEAAVHALVSRGVLGNEPEPERFAESALLGEARAMMPEPDADPCAEVEPILMLRDAPPNEPALETIASVPSRASKPEESQKGSVEPDDAEAGLKDEQVEVDAGHADEGLATLPAAVCDEAARTYLIPSRPVAFIPRWFGPRETVVVAGLVLPGMVRVGASSAAGGSLHDPSMIDPDLPVDGSSSVCTLLNDSSLDYATLAPRDRGAYLNWLVNGRSSPLPAGLAMLFFKGLERRTFEIHSEPGAGDELGQLTAEMRALAARYGQLSRSLQTHASDLSTLVEFGLTNARAYAVERRSLHPTFSPSFELRLAVAHAAFDHASLPADWALDWVLQDANGTVRTSALRCATELQRLFRARYRERYGAGVKLPSEGRQLALSYCPISQAIPQGKTLTVATKSTADVSGFSSVHRELSKLVDGCLEELSSFSHLAGRIPVAARTLEGLVRLPLDAWPADATEWFTSLGAAVRKAPQTLSLNDFRRRFGGRSTVSKGALLELFKVLGSFNVGVEPLELAAMNEVFTVERIALFSDSGSVGQHLHSEDFKVCSSVVDLAISLAMSGGEMTTEDKEAITSEVNRWRQLQPGHVARLRARIEVVRRNVIDVKAALKQLSERDEETRLEVLNFLTQLAFLDIDFTKARSAALIQLRAALTSSRKAPVPTPAPPATAPRKVAASPVMHPSRPKVVPKRLTLDPIRVAIVQQETAKVAKLLHGVFSEDDELAHAKPPATVPSQVHIAPSALALDTTHRQFLGHLLGRQSWALDDLQTLVAQHDLMLDGAIETLNEAVFDAFGVGLIEGDDPLEVNSDVGRLILQAAKEASAPTTD